LSVAAATVDDIELIAMFTDEGFEGNEQVFFFWSNSLVAREIHFKDEQIFFFIFD